jgi:molybdopterin/thiamine biosynthesis adenylyltransferase
MNGGKMFYSRNIGLITEKEQEKLCKSNILIAGVGGMGGVAAEMLVRMGVGNITLCDHDIFEEVNFNRQLHSNVETIGLKKVEVLKKEFLKINPNLNIKTFSDGVTVHNIHQMLEGIDVVINGMDKMFYSLVLERTARAYNITIVDAWLTPFASVFVMKPDSPHWEDFLDLPTKGVALQNITEELCRLAVKKEVEYTFSHFDPYEHINPDLVNEITSGVRPRPSLAPVVWLSGALMASEAMKFIIGQKTLNHLGVFYNQYEHKIQSGKLFKLKKVKVS